MREHIETRTKQSQTLKEDIDTFAYTRNRKEKNEARRGRMDGLCERGGKGREGGREERTQGRTQGWQERKRDTGMQFWREKDVFGKLKNVFKQQKRRILKLSMDTRKVRSEVRGLDDIICIIGASVLIGKNFLVIISVRVVVFVFVSV